MSFMKYSRDIVKKVISKVVEEENEGFYLIDGEGIFEGKQMVLAILTPKKYFGLVIYGGTDSLNVYLPDGTLFIDVDLEETFRMDAIEDAHELGNVIGYWWEAIGKDICEKAYSHSKTISQTLKKLNKDLNSILDDYSDVEVIPIQSLVKTVGLVADTLQTIHKDTKDIFDDDVDINIDNEIIQ